MKLGLSLNYKHLNCQETAFFFFGEVIKLFHRGNKTYGSVRKLIFVHVGRFKTVY